MDPTKAVDVEGQGQRDLVEGLRRRQMQQSWLAGWKGHLGKNGVTRVRPPLFSRGGPV